MKWRFVIGALVIGAGLCNPGYGFEWLDNLLGIDLDNSDAAPDYGYYSTGYAPYATSYPAYGYGSYRPVYQSSPVTTYRPAPTYYYYGNQVTTMRPVVTYPTQTQVVPYTVNQPVYAPATSYAQPTCNCATGH